MNDRQDTHRIRAKVTRLGLGLACLAGVSLNGNLAWTQEGDPNGNLSLSQGARPRWQSWDLSAEGGYASAGPFSGWDLGASAYWFPIRYVGVGMSADSARIRLHGSVDRPGQSPVTYSYGLRSTYWGAGVKLRLPVWRLAGYLRAEIGRSWPSTTEASNVQCSYQGGMASPAELGVEALVWRNLVLGVGWMRRSHSNREACANMAGLATTPLDPMNAVMLSIHFNSIR